jgi:HEAT repeat protein
MYAPLQVLALLSLSALPADDVALATLIKQLDSRSFQEREDAAKKLEDIGEAALPALQEVLKKHGSLELRRRAERAIEAIEKTHIRPRALRTLQRLRNQFNPDGEEHIPDLVWLLRTDDYWVRASWILASLGARYPGTAVPLLLHQAQRGPPPIRLRAIETLESIGARARAAAPTMVRLLKDNDPWVRSRAAKALGRIGDVAAIPEVLSLLASDGNYDVRRRAATALGELRAECAIPALIQAMKDESKLLDTLELTESKRGGGLLAALPEGTMSSMRDQRGLAARAGDALVSIGPCALTGVRDLLKEKDTRLRRDAVWALYRLSEQTPLAIEPLTWALDDKEFDIRQIAIEGLGLLGPQAKSALVKLERLLKDSDEQVRVGASEAMLRIDVNQAAPLRVLNEALRSKTAQMRAAATNALYLAGPRAKASVPRLLALLTDSEESVRKNAAETLKAIDPEAAAKAGIK